MTLAAVEKRSLFREMTVIDAIYSRHAVRQYSLEIVTEHAVRQLLDAAAHAPSALNLQPWAFVIIQEQSHLNLISDVVKQTLQKDPGWSSYLDHHGERAMISPSDPKFDIFYGATTLVVICAKADGLGPACDCFLAGENLMLAAHAMGLGTCPIGLARDFLQSETMMTKLQIPVEYTPILPIIVGFPVGNSPKTDRNPPKILNWVR